jgi:Domain of unknown function (DUF3854)
MTLAPHHQQLISSSGISDEVRDQRGYSTVTVSAELALLGFAPGQRTVPALVIPQYDVEGNVSGHQLRPDVPRVVAGKAPKYETPKGARLRIDVPPGARSMIGDPSVTLYITEGSRKADAGVSHGMCCVSLSGVWGWRGTNQYGGKAALPDWDSIALNGRKVRVAFDSDVTRKPNVQEALIRLIAFLRAKQATVAVVLFPEKPNGMKTGLDDFLSECNDPAQLDALCMSSLPAGWSRARRDWPEPPSPAAFQGLAGEIVHGIDGYTEADPVAVLVHLLAGFGSLIGAGPHVLVGATPHPARLFAALVGSSSKARKGTAWSPVKHLLREAEPCWAGQCVTSGLSSGEGLIANVRDAQTKENEEGDLRVIDAGIADKRLFVIEEELARVLKSSHRQNNTLSPILRQAWDTGELRTMVKTDPQRATGAHISVVGHITQHELRRELTDTETANGFANRFLWVAVKRSKELPEPEPFEGVVVEGFARQIATSAQWARRQGRVERDPDASALWREVYSELSAERDGLAGAVLARAEAHVTRLSLVYALMDQSASIGVEHLAAALALWEYCERTVTFLFDDNVGDPVAARIGAAVQSQGLTRTQINGLFGGHRPAAHIAAALDTLSADGRLTRTIEHTGGRSVEVWTPTT